MVGVLRIVHDRKTGKVIHREIIEELDMTEEEYYKPLVEIEGQAIMQKIEENRISV